MIDRQTADHYIRNG